MSLKHAFQCMSLARLLWREMDKIMGINASKRFETSSTCSSVSRIGYLLKDASSRTCAELP